MDTCYVVQDIFTGFILPKAALTAVVPTALKEKISVDIEQLMYTTIPHDSDAATEDLKSSIQMILMRLPVSGYVAAYILHVKMMEPVNKYFVYLYSSDGAVSRKPFTYWGGDLQEDEKAFGSGHLPEMPNYGVTDIDSDGRPEMMLRERRHNGNVYDANVVHYIHYDSSMQLTEALPLEAWATVPFDTTAHRIRRSLRYNAATEEYIVSAALAYRGQEQAFGSVYLRRGPGGSWQTGKRIIEAREYARLLITCSPTRKEEEFLNEESSE